MSDLHNKVDQLERTVQILTSHVLHQQQQPFKLNQPHADHDDNVKILREQISRLEAEVAQVLKSSAVKDQQLKAAIVEVVALKAKVADLSAENVNMSVEKEDDKYWSHVQQFRNAFQQSIMHRIDTTAVAPPVDNKVSKSQNRKVATWEMKEASSPISSVLKRSRDSEFALALYTQPLAKTAKQEGPSKKQETRSGGRKTPRTPSLTGADKVAVIKSEAASPPPQKPQMTKSVPVPQPAVAPAASTVRINSNSRRIVVPGRTPSPAPTNPRRGSEGIRRFVLSGLSDPEKDRVIEAVRWLGTKDGGSEVLDSGIDQPPPHSVTHVVIPSGTPRSFKALCGLVASKWLVNPQYIFNSADCGFWLDEGEEGGLRCYPPPLLHCRFLVNIPDHTMSEKVSQIIDYGQGQVVRTGRVEHGVAVITSGDELLGFCNQPR